LKALALMVNIAIILYLGWPSGSFVPVRRHRREAMLDRMRTAARQNMPASPVTTSALGC
jgi:hypothetical protein